ncbi:MAG: phasin family protein [Rhizobiales bacterium]|nr:phasin family protein [Hyphomicrobiales bacterium]MBI3674833.1 phasin family protein [Hyphomicrobiales bacterium]
MSNKKVKVEVNTEIPAEVTAFAHKSMDQAQAAFDKASEFAHSNVQLFDAAASAYKSRFADLQLKAMEITQANVLAGFAFARKLFAVKEPTEFFTLQQEFAREQAQVLQRQVSELNELSVALAKETVKPVQDGFSKSFADFTKNLAA